MKAIKTIDLGTIGYEEALEIQLKHFHESIDNKANGKETFNYLLICQHQPVYTLGKNGDIKNLIAQPEGTQVIRTNRGGDITFHGLGQLVIYPIFDLENFNIGLAEFVSKLETIGIQICAEYGITATRSPGENGVWLDIDGNNPRKIMAIGIKASRHITMHGLAFNVNTDLAFFDHIIPCGISGKSVTSLAKEKGNEPSIEMVKQQFVAQFDKYFI